MSSEIREEVLKLMQKKEKIEDEIQQLTSILEKNGLGMNEPLVDAAGFPLKNVDVYQVRHARHRIICLQNDHKALMKQIESGLHGYYNASSTEQGTNSSQDMEMQVDRPPLIVHKIPFAKVDLVSPASPADYSGLKENDLIVEFGSVNSSNFRAVTDIAGVVQHSEGQKINIKIQRDSRYLTMALVPKKWQGRGLLGCNIVPLTSS